MPARFGPTVRSACAASLFWPEHVSTTLDTSLAISATNEARLDKRNETMTRYDSYKTPKRSLVPKTRQNGSVDHKTLWGRVEACLIEISPLSIKRAGCGKIGFGTRVQFMGAKGFWADLLGMLSVLRVVMALRLVHYRRPMLQQGTLARYMPQWPLIECASRHSRKRMMEAEARNWTRRSMKSHSRIPLARRHQPAVCHTSHARTATLSSSRSVLS